MQSYISLILIFACIFPHIEAKETQAMLNLFNRLANASPPALNKEKFTEFVKEVVERGPPSLAVAAEAWYLEFPQNVTQQEAIDFCRVYGDLLKDAYFTVPRPNIHEGNIEKLYKTCEGSEEEVLTLAGLRKFVNTAFKDVTPNTIKTWYKFVSAFQMFTLKQIQQLCKNNADRLTFKYVIL